MNDVIKYKSLFKFLNQSKSDYMGLTFKYEYDIMNMIEVDLEVEGDFPLPMYTKEMFEHYLSNVYYDSKKYFGLSMSKRVSLNTIELNGIRVGNDLTIGDKLSEDLVEIDKELSKQFKCQIYHNSTFKSDGNEIKTWLDLMDRDVICYTVNIENPNMLYYNDNPFNRNTIIDFLGSVSGLSVSEPDDMFEIISNNLWEWSIEGTGDTDGISSFWGSMDRNGMDYSNHFMKDFGLIAKITINNYDGMVNGNSENYNTEQMNEELEMFIGWLNSNKGKYKL